MLGKRSGELSMKNSSVKLVQINDGDKYVQTNRTVNFMWSHPERRILNKARKALSCLSMSEIPIGQVVIAFFPPVAASPVVDGTGSGQRQPQPGMASDSTRTSDGYVT